MCQGADATPLPPGPSTPENPIEPTPLPPIHQEDHVEPSRGPRPTTGKPTAGLGDSCGALGDAPTFAKYVSPYYMTYPRKPQHSLRMLFSIHKLHTRCLYHLQSLQWKSWLSHGCSNFNLPLRSVVMMMMQCACARAGAGRPTAAPRLARAGRASSRAPPIAKRVSDFDNKFRAALCFFPGLLCGARVLHSVHRITPT